MEIETIESRAQAGRCPRCSAKLMSEPTTDGRRTFCITCGFEDGFATDATLPDYRRRPSLHGMML